MDDCNSVDCCKEKLAGQLYSTYRDAVGAKAYNGTDIPTWDEFSTDPEKTRSADGWRAVASYVKGCTESNGTCAEVSEPPSESDNAVI